jgi:hypothetical protein
MIQDTGCWIQNAGYLILDGLNSFLQKDEEVVK